MRRHTTTEGPLGPITLVVEEGGALAGLYFAEHSPPPKPSGFGEEVTVDDPSVAAIVDALAAYLSGRSPSFEPARTSQAGTAFQQAVWREVSTIGVGEVRTYAQIAEAVGHPTAHRAVGAAIGRNALCLAVPCHRVVASGGRIVGYAGGVERKRWLLAKEAGAPLPPLAPPTGER